MAELSVAVVGCGPAGQVHLQCWAVQTGVQIAAVCDTDGLLAARTAASYPGAAAFTDTQAMLNGMTFDIVDVCVPPGQHAAIVETALRAGAHVLCEKPLALDPNQARALAQLASDRERLLSVMFCHRFHPPVLFLKELLDNDDIGTPAMFRFRLSGFWVQAEEKNAGIDVLWDTAIHGLDLFRALCGEVSSLTMEKSRINLSLSLDDTVVILLRSERGAIGVLEASWSTPGGRSVLELYGSAGACIVDYDTGTLRYLTADQPFWQTREEGGPNRFERQIAHFADAVRGLQPLLVTGEDGAVAVALCADLTQRRYSE
jgi:predicted dehydrogenase